MFTRPSLVKTQIKKNKNGKRVLMKTLGIFELHSLVDKTYSEFCNGKSINKIFQEHAVAKKHANDYSTLLLNKFLKTEQVVNINDNAQLKMFARFIALKANSKEIDLGFVYCIANNNKIKIGRSVDFLKRFNSYKSHIGEYPTVLRLEFVSKHVEFEQFLINKLQTLGHTNEWFDETYKDLILSFFKR
jgi:hypothetical protein